MKFIIHADDFGCSKGITDAILDCFDHGSLTSTSILPNGHGFDYAIREYKKRRGLRLGIHLDFVEGKSIAPADQVPLLVDKKGFFKHSVPSLWMAYLLAGRQTKEAFRRQVKLELEAQIRKVISALGKDFSIRLDSHCHCHVLPFIFDEILNLKKIFNISYVRVPKERFYLCFDSAGSFKNYFQLNLIKFLMANWLMKGKREQLAKCGIQSNDAFIGVLFVTSMSYRVVEKALKIMNGRNGLVEILFHPGSASADERGLFNKRFVSHYFAAWQLAEQKVLKSDEFRNLIAKAEALS